MDSEAVREREDALTRMFGDVGLFSHGLWPERTLRRYQEEVARAIVESVRGGLGRQFAVVFARQAGKDELLAQTIAYLLNLYRHEGGSIVVAAPTFRPQSLIARSRLLERLDNPYNRHYPPRPVADAGYIVALGRASARFLSAGPTANVRGETASLLVCNEAQDVDPDRWDAAFDPMAASTNATTVFSGTVWSDRTLLARQMRHLRALERADGVRRVFTVPWIRVAADLPAYGERVRARIAQFGRDHPFIRTEYELQEIAGAGGLFSPARQAQLRGDHPRQRRATPGHLYALLIDVAGEDDELANLPDDGALARAGRRDSTALTVVEIIPPDPPSAIGYPPQRVNPQSAMPSYRVVDRRLWTGARHTDLHATIVDLARNVWRARRVVVDATGIGAGLASWLAAALPGLVVPLVFTAQAKSDLGWRLLAAIDGGRLKDYADDGADDTRLFWRQLDACAYAVRPGPGKLLAWGVDDPRTHDDLLLSLALVGALDDADWRPRVARGSGG
jgi:hypothetical protein